MSFRQEHHVYFTCDRCRRETECPDTQAQPDGWEPFAHPNNLDTPWDRPATVRAVSHLCPGCAAAFADWWDMEYPDQPTDLVDAAAGALVVLRDASERYTKSAEIQRARTRLQSALVKAGRNV